MPLSYVSKMAARDMMFVVRKRLEYFFKYNILGYPLEAVEEDDAVSSVVEHPAAVQMPHGAFQLLRIKNRYMSKKKDVQRSSISPTHWYFLRFSEHSPPGGYRDINIKLKIGFRWALSFGNISFDVLESPFPRDCDSSRNPLFLPVQQWNELAGVKRIVVEIQLHLKVLVIPQLFSNVVLNLLSCFTLILIFCCALFFSSSIVILLFFLFQTLYDKAQEVSSVHLNYIQARNLQSK
jgi:hypothetical protein